MAAYTFRDERDLLWYSTVFSAAERESAYVIDGLMHNEVVKSDIHSTDAFGFSELVFAVSHLLGFSYAPRFKNLPRQRLYIFRNRKGVDRSAWKIKPAGYADDEIVIQQWDEILRMIATIKLKEVTASDLFRRLNSYSKQHALYRALKAFGQIPKSLFILQVIDDPVLRQAIEKQMDRIEHVHPSRGPSQWATRGNSCRQRKKTRRSRKPASGSSRTASFAGIISTFRRS